MLSLDGQNTRALGQSALPKIFHFTEIRKGRMCRGNPAQEEGRIAIVTNAGRAAVDAGHIGAKSFAGRRAVSESIAHKTGVISVRQNRVVLTPGVCASSLVVMCVGQPDARVSHPQGDGGNSATLPEESTT
ncbi:hypothetical protein [Bradyrhizobium sp. 138]|uniref:hypothetical protein n=1 Tax=Bradyrhizobium sp. 138 TaxID=2782615 RepID=UPI001FF7BEBF|nr:hypothetical protein [Bradyrhizobium sp. 138]